MHDSKKNMFQKCLSVLLAFVLIFGAMPITVFAESNEPITVSTDTTDDTSPVEREIVYKLSMDSGIQDQEIGTTGAGNPILNETPHLTGSGSPVFTIVAHPESGNSLQISNRDADWHTIDLIRGSLGLDARNTYQVTVEGRILGDRSDAQVQISRTGGSWGPFVSVAPAGDGTFVITLEVNAAIHAELAEVGGNGFRIRTNGTDDFIIDDITVSLPSVEEVEIPDPGVGTLIPENITLAPNRVRGFEIDGFGVERSELSWQLSGNVSSQTTIEDGFLRIADDNPLGTIVVRAYVTADPTIYGVAVVTVGGANTSLIYNLPAGLNFDAYPSLRAVYEDYFKIGVAGDSGLIAGATGTANLRGQLIGYHYNSWSFENSMKPQPLRGNNVANRLQPSNQWPGISGPTNTINAARARYDGMTFAGHTTAWHSQSPEWMWDRHPGGHTSREVALENLQFHVHETFRQFGHELSSMDVVNEALGSVNPANPSDWRDALTRGEGWAPTLGYDWVMYAFIFAAEIVDELELDVTLYYNDFLLHTTNKGIAAYTMVRDINQMHADGDIIHPITGEMFQRSDDRLLIEGVGMQDRQSGILDIDGFSNAINLFAELGVVISITEMDLSWRITSPDGLLTPEEQIAQGQQMARFFEMIRRYAVGPATAGSPYPRVVERITFWGIDDTHSWSPGEPMLFGRPTGDMIPGKEALRAVIDPFQFLEDHPWTPEEIPPVPGVHVFNLQDDGFSGVNIILGNDESVWPFSTAGDDGVVAFRPQPGATYHMLVYYQSFETFGLEAHWLRDNSQDNFTVASRDAALTMEQITRGTATTGPAAPTATEIPNRFSNPGVGGSFAWLETTFTMPEEAQADGLLGNIALRGIHEGDGILVHSIIIHRQDEAGNNTDLLVNYPYQLPLVRPEIPGIIVPEPNDAQNNGRADIIIGTGRDVWPFADAHASGRAFDPEPGVTYRLMFNVRTTGAGGWRVRWIPGTGGEDYTTADGAVVNNYPMRVSSFGLGVPTPESIPDMPVGSVIPSHPNQGVNAAGVYTVVQDITLSAEEVYQGLIGNIALRGTGGSGNFVVNWIAIQELEAGPGSHAVETLNFWPFGVEAFDDFNEDFSGFMQRVEGFASNHFEPNILNVNGISLTPITRQGENAIINATNPPLVGETLVAGHISGGAATGVPAGSLRSGTTQGFLVGNAQYEWLVNGEVVQAGPENEFTILPEHLGHPVQLRLTSDWETGELTSAVTPIIEGNVEPQAPVWSFTTEQDSVQAVINELPEIEMGIHLENVTDVAGINATYQWFARLAEAPAHATGVPVTAPSQIDLNEAIGSGYSATLQLADEVGLIPRLPGVGQGNNVVMGGTFTSETWEYFVVVVYEVVGLEDSDPVTSVDDDEVIVLTVEYTDFILNQPPRDYFPNVNDPDLTSLLPMTPYLNDPFVFFESLMSDSPQLGTDGRVETEDDWWERNEEIRDIIGYYMYGIQHATPIENITVNAPTTLNLGVANPINVTIRSNGRVWTGNIGNITMPTAEQIEASPFSLEEGIPIVLGGSNVHALQNGIATATIAGPTLNAAGTGGGAYFTLHPFNFGITEFNVGSIMANAWHSSRLLDAIALNPDWGVNPNASATIGVSIGGKIAMFRGVMDERVALTVPVESGAFGMTALRDTTEGRVSFHHVNQFGNQMFNRAQKPLNSAGFTGEMAWFAMGTFRNPVTGTGGVFNDIFSRLPKEDSVYHMPFDQHLVAALAAPRPLLSFDNDGSGSGNGWMNPYTQLAIAEGAREVYGFLGVAGNIAVRVRDQNHAVQARDWPFVVGTLTAMFGDDRTFDVTAPREITDITVLSVVGMNPPSYDAGTYATIEAMGVSPFELDTHFIRWARPGHHAIWTHTQLVTEGFATVIEAHTTAPAGTVIVLNHFNHGDRNRHWDVTPERLEYWTATVGEDGIAIFDLDNDEVQVGRYQLTFQDGAIGHRSAYFLGIDTHTALRSAVSPGLSHMYRAFGFTSRINPDTVRVYTVTADGAETYIPSVPIEEAITMPGTTNMWGGWIMEYGVAMPGQGAAGGTNNRLPANGTLTLRGIQFEAVPDFTFEVSFGLGANAAAANHGTPWATSEAVQAAQPFPHWPPVGGLSGAGGESGPFGAEIDGTRAFAPQTQTEFNAELSHQLIVDEVTGELEAWVIDFDQEMNPRDFGVGFNFSDDFTVVWSEDHTRVTLTFNVVDFTQVSEPEMLIMRLRDATSGLGNVISTYRRYAASDFGYQLASPMISQLSIGGIEGIIDQEAATITFTAPSSEVVNGRLAGTITELEADTDEVVFFVYGSEWTLRQGEFAGVYTGDTVRANAEDAKVYTIIIEITRPMLTRLSIGDVVGIIDQEAATITFTAPSSEVVNGRLAGAITDLEADTDEVVFFVHGSEWTLRQGEFAGVYTGDTVRANAEDAKVYTIIIQQLCEVVVEGEFAGADGATWRLCEDGTLEVDSGFINWTGTNSPWHAHRAGITGIEFTGEVRAGTSLRALFRGLDQVKTIEGLTYFDTSQTLNMSNMFRDMSSLTALDVSSFDTRNAVSLNAMFMGASSLTELDVSHFNTAQVIDMESMFRGLSNVTALDVSSLDTTRVVMMANMFRNMSNLESLDLSAFNTGNVADMRNMLNGMPSLSALALGEDFAFVGTAHLLPLTRTDAFTGRWVDATGTHVLSSAQLMAQFDRETMAGTWVWQAR